MRLKHTMWPYVNTFAIPSSATDKQQIVGFLATGLVYTSSIVNALVYDSDGAMEAAAAGFILLSMVAVCFSSFTPHRIPANHRLPDCLDLLLRLRSTSSTSRLYRFVRTPQRTTRLNAQRTTNVSTLQRPPRNNGIGQSSTADVHLSTAQRV